MQVDADLLPFSVDMIPPSWKIAALGDVCSEITDGDWIETKDQGGNDYRLLQISNIGIGEFIETGKYRYVTQETYDKLRCKEIVSGQILVARMPDPVGRAWYVKSIPFRAITAVDVAILTPNPSILDGKYCSYYLNSPQNLAYAQLRASGTTRLRITRRDLATFRIPLPPLSVQRKIAAMLSAYDDLIEVNTRRIRVLEAMAHSVHREWFGKVDPQSLPEGWEVKTFSDVCNQILDGDWIETKDQGGEDYRLLQVSNIGVGEFIETGNFRYITRETFDRLNCQEVVPGDILVSRMPTPIGRGWLVTEMPWRMITAVDVAIVRPNPDLLNRYYCVHWLNSSETLDKSEKHSSGTTRPRITRRVLSGFDMIVPPIELQNKFGEFAGNLYGLQTTLQRQNANLRRTRDLLLPRLVSGEVEIV